MLNDGGDDEIADPVAIVDIRAEHVTVPVYNLHVEGTHTYFVNGVWVHNNSCRSMFNMPRFRGRPPRNLKEELALAEAAGGAGKIVQGMEPLIDSAMQSIAKGVWRKYQFTKYFHDGTKVVIHSSIHTAKKIVWDVKIKSPK